MAKLFYTLEEAAQRLRKSTEEIMAMARSGQLQELKDKDQVLFRRSAIDQLASEDDTGEISLDNFDSGSSGSDIRLGGSSIGGGDDLRLDEPPMAASGADDSMMDEIAPSKGAGSSRSSSGSGLNLDDSIGLSDSSVKPVAKPAARKSPADINLGDSSDSMIMDAPDKASLTAPGDSAAMDGGNTSLETVGSGSGLLDISSDESFFGAAMIEDSVGGEGEGAAAIPGDAADIFGGGDHATGEEAAPVTTGTAGVTFGSTAMAEARDPAFSGFTAGAMLVGVLALVALAWATIEIVLGGYSDLGTTIAQNWTMVLGGLGAGVVVAGAIGFGIGKATA